MEVLLKLKNLKFVLVSIIKFFSFGYCTLLKKQAIRWATRFGEGYINEYDYAEDDSLKILLFNQMIDEWLDFVVSCRCGKKHDYDMVECPIADDIIYNYIQDFLDEKYRGRLFGLYQNSNIPHIIYASIQVDHLKH